MSGADIIAGLPPWQPDMRNKTMELIAWRFIKKVIIHLVLFYCSAGTISRSKEILYGIGIVMRELGILEKFLTYLEKLAKRTDTPIDDTLVTWLRHSL